MVPGGGYRSGTRRVWMRSVCEKLAVDKALGAS
jgi:hypothetical protein